MPKLIEVATTAIIIVGLVVILSGCTGNRFGYYHPKCDIDGAAKLCK